MESNVQLVKVWKGESWTTSRRIAEDFEKNHQHILEKIRNLTVEISTAKLDPDYQPKFIKSNYINSRGQMQPEYLLNSDAFTEVVSNLNGVKSRQWKRKYHAVFNKMEKYIINQQNTEWIETRQDVKINQKRLQDILQGLVKYAKAQGSKHADKLYINYNRLINKTLWINPNSKDGQPTFVLHEIRKLQAMIETVVKGMMRQQKSYKEIYQGTKTTLENYAALAFVGQQQYIS